MRVQLRDQIEGLIGDLVILGEHAGKLVEGPLMKTAGQCSMVLVGDLLFLLVLL